MNIESNNQLAEIKVSYSNTKAISKRIKISKSSDAAEFFRTIWSDQIEFREEFVMLLLNRANHVIGWFKVSSGGTTGTVVDPKIIFSIALKCMTQGIILCHNHPSGNTKPSETDLSLTKKLKRGCELLDITLVDHIILTSESYYSMADEGGI